ncbi:citrate synthase-like protein [Suillus clintonianus]|uniref:citrate synthase-like protein n=1 Tax=Suillus clintonianus TaxID=1904413 RepID=UPI001B86A69E|nr:citrate synthase-like protein [Suillus clintonianus]KAG2125404.1 citrate synthase-like protein [Suillus clintonianus]
MGKQIPVSEFKRDESLRVVDNRTGKEYTVPIAHNSIPATFFKGIRAPAGPNDRPEDETERGLRVADRGFLNTAVIESSITYIDGDNGVLRYRGYPIEQLAARSNFLEVSYLLIYGALPSASQLSHFTSEVLLHGPIHSDAEGFFRAFRYDAHPMSMLTSAFAYLGSYYGEANPSLQGQDLFTKAAKGDAAALQNMDRQIFRLIGKATTLAAMAYRIRQGRDFVVPPTGMSYTESFLYQLDHLSPTDLSELHSHKPHPVLAKALDILFILHADHEMNASSTTVLQTGSSLPDPFSAVAAGCASLYGPLHGGANEAVIRMLVSIGSPKNVPAFLEAVKKRQKVLSGFGHRVYKTSDPRSFIIRKVADEVFAVTGPDPLLDTAMALHDAALKDDYFVSRKLAPNVDFWSGLIYRAMGFPMDFFPVLFVVPRVVGWVAHWRQMMLSPSGVKIWRPRQLYLGPSTRDYVTLEERTGAVQVGVGMEPSVIEHSGMTKRRKLAEAAGTVKSKL